MGKGGRPRKYDLIADDISWAIEKHENNKAKELLSNTTIDILDGEARTPLINAAFSNNDEILSWVINHEANINHQDRNGWCALHAAAQNGHSKIIKILLEAGANPNLIDSYGNSPLWTATHNACLAISTEQNFQIVSQLLKKGSDPHHKNNYNRSPFDISERSPKVREIFLADGK